MGLGWILLLTVVFLILLMVGSSFYFMRLMQSMVFSRLQDLDSIRTNGLPPERWQKGYLNRARKRGGLDPADYGKQKKKNLKKLKDITRFTRKTNLVEDEQTRSGVLSELSAVYKEWEEETYDEACGKF